MTQPPPSLEYSPEQLEGGVVVRKSDSITSISLRYHWRRMVGTLVAPVVLLLCSAVTFYLLVILPRRSGPLPGGGWGGLLFPLVFLALSLVQGLAGIWPMLFPVIVEVHADQLIMKWRTVTELRTQAWNRLNIRQVSVERLRIQNRMLKQWFLVFQTLDQGKVAVLSANRRQLELVARTLREHMGFSEESHPAMRPPPPPACRYKRQEWAGGIMLVIPPRKHRQFSLILAACCLVLAGAGFVFLGNIRGWDDVNILSTVAVMVALCLTVGGLLYWVLQQGLNKLSPRTRIVITPQAVHAVQTGFVRPLNVAWKITDLRTFEALETRSGQSSLQLVPHQGPPLVVAEKQRTADAQWAAQILQIALATATTTPVPAAPAPASAP